MFFWANRKIECIVLKKFLMNNKVCADLAMFSLQYCRYKRCQLIFVDGMQDTVKERFALLAGERRCVDVPWNLESSQKYSERLYSKKQAGKSVKNAFRNIIEAEPGSRHQILYNMGIWMGKLIAQELLDEEETIEYLLDACLTWGDGNPAKDKETLLDSIKRGSMVMEGEM